MSSLKVSPEVQFCQLIAANQQTVRNKGIKKLKRWLSSKSAGERAFTEEDMLKIWKGLYYFFWMCDKPLVQENMAEQISSLIHCFQKPKYVFLFIDTFLQTMSREWYGIDVYRIEKFMMFIRKFLHQSFVYVKKKNWDMTSLKKLRKVLRKTVISPADNSTLLGLRLHIVDIYMEELANVGGSELTSKHLRFFLVPYCDVLRTSENKIYMDSVCKNVFGFLIDQDEEDENKINFSPSSIEKLLMKFANKGSIKNKNMRIMYKLVKRFRDFSEGYHPLDKMLNVPVQGCRLRKRAIEQAAENLLREDEEFCKEKQSFKRSKKTKKQITYAHESSDEYEFLE